MPPAPYAPMDKDTSGAYVAGLLLGFFFGIAVASFLIASGVMRL